MHISRQYYHSSIRSFYQLRQKVQDLGTSLKEVSLVVTDDGRYFRESEMCSAEDNFTVELLCDQLPVDFEEKVSNFYHNLSNDRDSVNSHCELSEFEVTADDFGFLTIKGQVRNSGSSWWFGCHALPQKHEAIGILVFSSSNTLVFEDRINFFFECLAPQSIHQFAYVSTLSNWGLAPGQYRVELGMVREGVAWFNDKDNRPANTITLEKDHYIKAMDYSKIKGNPNALALTFDGGASDRCSDELLNSLSEESIRCTFFLTGAFINKFPELVLKIVSAGHEIANHTHSHRRLCFDCDPECAPGIDESQLLNEIEETEKLFHSTTRLEMSRLWRAPFGGRNTLISSWLVRRGYRHISWSLDSRDFTIGKPSNFTFSVATMVERVKTFLASPTVTGGEILLFHLASSNRRDPIPPGIVELIRYAKNSGFKFATVGEMLEKAEGRP